jgi:ribosomal protection tetracycline resistance protein
MQSITAGIIAHVDAGKTTLSEALLYRAGTLRQLGRVDKGDAFLDPDDLEKQRGITIFSHQANLSYQDLKLTLLDTPGHVDFASQTEQVLSVLDYANVHFCE